jgi:hypothetical protein
MQGSVQYLRDTLNEMVQPGKPAEMRRIARELRRALADGRVEYYRVSPQFRDNGTGYFSIQRYDMSGGRQP